MLLHPLGADRHVWEPLTPLLAERRELIVIDLPGFGESPALSGQVPTPRALAAAVAEHLTAIGVERLVRRRRCPRRSKGPTDQE